ncbi:MAG: UspA protein [Actinomycetospora sp.]|nr:UspA protein [Actinomycetospora sp.]
MGEPNPVLVGVDGSCTAWDALDWAAAEAAARGCPLRIVTACPPPVAPGPFGPVADVGGAGAAAAEELLRQASQRARAVAPELEVTGRTVVGGAAPALTAQPAQLVVVGTRARGRVRRALAGSVSVGVCSRAPCPVVVVPPRREVEPGPSRVRVVVGVDGSGSAPALAVAFAAAAQRGIGLTALHAWTPHPPADLDGLGDDRDAAELVARDRLTAALAPWRREFPGVGVRLTLVADEPARALAAESAGAALLVIGSRGRGCLSGALFGSVGQAVLRHARCPAAVVRPTAPTTGRTRAARRRGHTAKGRDPR